MDLGLILFLAALAGVGFWLVLQRIALLEQRMQSQVRAEDLARSLDPLRAALDRVAVEVQSTLEEMRAARGAGGDPEERSARHSDLKPLLEQQQKISSDLAAVNERLARIDRALGKEGESLDRQAISFRVQRSLEDEGFSAVFVAEPGEPTESGGLRLLVEARKDGVSYKGAAMVEQGRVQSLTIRPAYQVFP